ncbi:divergent PAP2 family protein [Tindallia californiensis]|uniref:Divergent PAP2 family protein n=1 Tax=Tindallia californiensis TaxID=159292 RepID=A0A1H3NK16_9FIRM|nr:divergent PAP2 family protein [Tindallia californiensis]SDY89222.1 hypothetical protein SAMN05192546_105161 [Tindallia californiensis]
MNFIQSIGENRLLWVTLIAWFIAQGLKVLFTLIVDKRFNVLRFVGSGGMPSSHSSFVMSLATGTGRIHGWDSAIFTISLVFAFVVMYDAAGVRYAVGKQAIILNEIMKDYQKDKKMSEEQLKELVGHTPVEVFAGAVLGILVAIWML